MQRGRERRAVGGVRVRTISSNIAKGTCVTPPSASSKASVVNDFSPASTARHVMQVRTRIRDDTSCKCVRVLGRGGKSGRRTAAEGAGVGHFAAGAALLPDHDLDAQPEHPPTHAQCHQRRASSRSSSQAAGATHVLFLWLNFRSPECPFLPRCLLNSLRALCAVVFRKVWYDFLRRLKPESDADWCQCIVPRLHKLHVL